MCEHLKKIYLFSNGNSFFGLFLVHLVTGIFSIYLNLRSWSEFSGKGNFLCQIHIFKNEKKKWYLNKSYLYY